MQVCGAMHCATAVSQRTRPLNERAATVADAMPRAGTLGQRTPSIWGMHCATALHTRTHIFWGMHCATAHADTRSGAGALGQRTCSLWGMHCATALRTSGAQRGTCDMRCARLAQRAVWTTVTWGWATQARVRAPGASSAPVSTAAAVVMEGSMVVGRKDLTRRSMQGCRKVDLTVTRCSRRRNQEVRTACTHGPVGCDINKQYNCTITPSDVALCQPGIAHTRPCSSPETGGTDVVQHSVSHVVHTRTKLCQSRSSEHAARLLRSVVQSMQCTHKLHSLAAAVKWKRHLALCAQPQAVGLRPALCAHACCLPSTIW